MHYYERNIVDIKQEYTEFLSHVITPLIYEGIKSMYNKALDAEQKYIQLAKNDPRVKNPGSLKIFQQFLKGIPSLNINLIEAETIRIRDSSKHADIFDKLIKAVIKSTIILLTYNASGQQCKLVNEKIHEKIDSKEFIHKIYIESAKQFYSNPELFWHQYPSIELKRNQKSCFDIINTSISIAVKQSIPMNDVLDEYLKNDYIIETEEQKMERLHKMINEGAEDNLNYFDDNDKVALISEESNLINNEINDEISKNLFNIDNLLNDNQTNNNTSVVNTEKVEENKLESEKDFAEKLAKVDLYSKQNRNLNRAAPLQKIPEKIEEKSLSDNIEIIKNNQQENAEPQVKQNLDERGYFNAMFNA
jgi:hypothetical protein